MYAERYIWQPGDFFFVPAQKAWVTIDGRKVLIGDSEGGRKEPKNDAERNLLDSLKKQRDFIAHVAGDKAVQRHDALLEHGRFYDAPEPGSKLPEGYDKMPNKACYENAGLIALRLGAGAKMPAATYVEGQAIAGDIPGWEHGHAWVTSGDGTAIDPTWHDPLTGGRGGVYFGMEIPNETLRTKVFKEEKWGPWWTPGTL